MIDRAGRKKLMGFGYLMMGVVMSVLIVMLTIKVKLITARAITLSCLFNV